jgi:dihydropyrimidinase
MSLLVKNGRIVTAADDYRADLYAEGEVITLIGQDLGTRVQADTVIDALGRLVFPGGIDPHTHLDMPFGGTVSADDFETGTRAAAFGGTTTIIDFAIQKRGSSMLEGLEAWHRKAEGKACIDYGFHMIISDFPEERAPEMRRLVEAGVTSYKLFMAYPGVLYSDDGALFRAYRQAALEGGVICMHAENGIVIDELIKRARAEGKWEPKWHGVTRPARMEGEAVHRSVAIAELAGVPLYIVHLTSADALEEVKRARDRGLPVHAETCPQYLVLDHSYLEQPGFEGAKYVMSPPLREKWHQQALWEGLRMNHLHATSTDHCPFFFKDQKELGRNDFTKIPNGAPGIENRVPLLYHHGVNEGRISLRRFVEVTSTNAARMFGLFPRKGTIAVGSDADLVIYDPAREEVISKDNPRTHHMNVDYTAYEGFRVKGYPEVVVARGKVVVDRGKWLGQRGAGRYLKRATYSGFNL